MKISGMLTPSRWSCLQRHKEFHAYTTELLHKPHLQKWLIVKECQWPLPLSSAHTLYHQ